MEDEHKAGIEQVVYIYYGGNKGVARSKVMIENEPT
jgi:hypothetical protein